MIGRPPRSPLFPPPPLFRWGGDVLGLPYQHPGRRAGDGQPFEGDVRRHDDYAGIAEIRYPGVSKIAGTVRDLDTRLVSPRITPQRDRSVDNQGSDEVPTPDDDR